LAAGKKKSTPTFGETLIKKAKKLSIDLGRLNNDLIEEGMRSLVNNYLKDSS